MRLLIGGSRNDYDLAHSITTFAGAGMHLQTNVAGKSEIYRPFICFTVEPAHAVAVSACIVHLCMCRNFLSLWDEAAVRATQIYSRTSEPLVEAEPLQRTLCLKDKICLDNPRQRIKSAFRPSSHLLSLDAELD